MGFCPITYFMQLEELVNCDSGTEDREGVNKIADYFQSYYEQAGFFVERVAGENHVGDCLVITNNESSADYDVLLVGHMDTVFKRGTALERPFRLDEQKAYGPGVADMKSGTLMIYHVLKRMAPRILENLSICVILNPDEETGSHFSAPIITEHAQRANIAFVMESAFPDGCHCVQRKGCVRYDISFSGMAAHSGYIFETENASAILEMSRWILALYALTNQKKGTSVNVGVVQGGSAINVVAEQAALQVEARMWESAEQQRIEDAIKALQKSPFDKQIKVTVREQYKRAAMEPSAETLAYLSRAKEIAGTIGLGFDVRARGGLSDANTISEITPICLDGMGPRGDLDHGVDEYMLIDSAEECFRLMRALLTDIALRKEATRNDH